MKILFITDNFYPERNAPAKRTHEHAIEWLKLNHEVTVITGAPNFPKGRVFKGYRNNFFKKENLDGINIKRVWTFIAPNKGFFLRILDYLSFMFSSLFCGIFTAKQDVIIATSPQFFTAISGWLISVLRRTPYVLEVRDLWPESIVAVGAMKENSLIIKLLHRIACFLYRRANAIVCVTNSFKQDLINLGIDANKIIVVENGINQKKLIPPNKTIQGIESEYNLDKNDFIVSFIGTIGMAHGLEVVLKAAKTIDDSKIKFIIIGDGANKDKLVLKANKMNLHNVIFIKNKSWQEIININQIVSVNLVHLINTPLFEKVIPSKIFESMALKKPIIMGVKGESNKIIQNANCGLDMLPEDPESLIHAINIFKNDSSLAKEKGDNGYEYVFKYYDRKVLAKKMITFIRKNI